MVDNNNRMTCIDEEWKISCDFHFFCTAIQNNEHATVFLGLAFHGENYKVFST